MHRLARALALTAPQAAQRLRPRRASTPATIAMQADPWATKKPVYRGLLSEIADIQIDPHLEAIVR